ncbi:MAG: hypothetical protein ACSLFQ_15630 [Thermoanaerobaculia bacterium]
MDRRAKLWPLLLWPLLLAPPPLLSSGFSDDDLSGVMGSNPRIGSLRKPFTGGELEDALSALLGGGRL